MNGCEYEMTGRVYVNPLPFESVALTGYERRRQFFCARCGAEPGQPCRTKRGGYSNEHASRWEQESAELRARCQR